MPKSQTTRTLAFRHPVSVQNGRRVYGKRVTIPFNNTPAQRAALAIFNAIKADGVKRLIGTSSYEELRRKAREAGARSEAIYIRELLERAEGRFTAAEQAAIISETRKRLGLHRPAISPFSSVGNSIEDSPEQVRSLIRQYAGDARRILDPFAGTANVPIVAGQLGIESFYCEIDPVMQFIAATKIRVLTLNKTGRERLLTRLRDHRVSIRRNLKAAEEMHDLAAPSFPSSLSEERREEFLSIVAKVRAVVARLRTFEPLAGDVAAIAYAGALDRVNNGEPFELSGAEGDTLLDQVRGCAAQELRSIATWIGAMPPLKKIPRFVCPDARSLDLMVPLDVDCVVTNPPPFPPAAPSTEFAQWFFAIPRHVPVRARQLQRVSTREDVRQLVTRRIEDKSISLAMHYDGTYSYVDLIAGLKGILDALDRANEYDTEVAAAAYFLDMAQVMRGVSGQLKPAARLIFEVRDSWFGNVHVATDVLLENLVTLFGFSKEQTLLIEQTGDETHRATNRVVVFSRTERRTPSDDPFRGDVWRHYDPL